MEHSILSQQRCREQDTRMEQWNLVDCKTQHGTWQMQREKDTHGTMAYVDFHTHILQGAEYTHGMMTYGRL